MLEEAPVLDAQNSVHERIREITSFGAFAVGRSDPSQRMAVCRFEQ
ncbi:MAG: hypothetical protein WBW73_01685 [Rhodoplanes sp.]